MSWRASGRCILKNRAWDGRRGERLQGPGARAPSSWRQEEGAGIMGEVCSYPRHLRRVGRPNQSLGTLPGRAWKSWPLPSPAGPRSGRTLGCLCAGLQVRLCSLWPPAVPRLCHVAGGGPHLTVWGGLSRSTPGSIFVFSLSRAPTCTWPSFVPKSGSKCL